MVRRAPARKKKTLCLPNGPAIAEAKTSKVARDLPEEHLCRMFGLDFHLRTASRTSGNLAQTKPTAHSLFAQRLRMRQHIHVTGHPCKRVSELGCGVTSRVRALAACQSNLPFISWPRLALMPFVRNVDMSSSKRMQGAP